jgi:hypothetical protein
VGGTVAGFVISGWQAGEESGTSVSSAGDFNGDGKADLLVSAYFNDTAGSQAGATYVILGKTGNTAVDLTNIKNNSGGFVILGENGQDMSGVSVSSGGDINGDGLGDILIGAVIAGSSNANVESGKTYVVFGRTTANATIDLGQIVAGNGDLNVKYYEGEFNAYQRTYILQAINESVLNPVFLFHFMEKYVDTLRNDTQGSTIQYLKKGQFTEAPIVLPPLAEQERIVEIVSSMDDVVQSTEQAVVDAKNLRSGLLSDLLSGNHEIPASYDSLLGNA